MSSNPFKPAAYTPARAGSASAAELLALCDERNSTSLARSMGWWYFVSHDKNTGTYSTQRLEGLLGDEVQRFDSGWRPDFINWPEERLAEYARKLRWYHKQGRLGVQPAFV